MLPNLYWSKYDMNSFYLSIFELILSQKFTYMFVNHSKYFLNRQQTKDNK